MGARGKRAGHKDAVMALHRSKLAATAALAAAFSLTATPASAAQLPRAAAVMPVKVYDSAAEDAANHRWGGYRYNRGPRTGDVIAGIVVLGTIAAIASSASKNRQRAEPYPDRYPDRNPYPEDRNYRTPRGQNYDSGGIGRAVDMCLDEVERMRGRVERVNEASRRGDGWRVSGQLESGDGFACQIDNDGRVSDVRIGGQPSPYEGAAAAPQGTQWNDEAYAQARRENGQNAERQPSYPGGLYEGEAATQDDGRYSLAEAPDFRQD